MAEIARPLDTPAAMRCSGDRQKSPHRLLLEEFVCTIAISVVGVIALFSSYDHVNLPKQWGVWLIALSLPLVFADAQLAARSRQRDADQAAVDAVGRRPK